MQSERTELLPTIDNLQESLSIQTQEEEIKDQLELYVRNLFLQNSKEEDFPFLMDKIPGFSPTRMVARYIYLYNQRSREGFSEEIINQEFSSMVETDLKAYASEFLYRSSVLQTNYEVRDIEGIPSVVMPKYDPNSALHTHVSLKERDGASFMGVINLERAILESSQHSTIIYGSPSGENGTGAPFQESQIHVVNIVDNQIIDTTLRNSLELHEVKKLLEGYGVTFDQENGYELIKEIASTVISIPRDLTPQEVLENMKIVHPGTVVWNRMKLVNNNFVFDRSFSFEDIYQTIENDSFLKMNEEVNEIALKLALDIQNNTEMTPEKIVEAVKTIGKAALTIAESIGYETGEIKVRTSQNGNYKEASRFASEGSGCQTYDSKTTIEEQYAKDSKLGKCVMCERETQVICGWCINCARLGKSSKGREEISVSPVIQEEDVHPSFFVALISGVFSTLTKN